MIFEITDTYGEHVCYEDSKILNIRINGLLNNIHCIECNSNINYKEEIHSFLSANDYIKNNKHSGSIYNENIKKIKSLNIELSDVLSMSKEQIDLMIQKYLDSQILD